MNSVLKIIIAIFFPPVTAGIQVGLSFHFWLNLVLTLLFWLPGFIHAVWLVLADKQHPGPA